MKNYATSLLKMSVCTFATLAISFDAWAYGELNCSFKPFPNPGCRIGRCVDGQWEQICDSQPIMSCGFKPFPNPGCRIGGCVDGSWEQICDQTPTMSCGFKPFPNPGCQIGRCVDGQWEQVCN